MGISIRKVATSLAIIVFVAMAARIAFAWDQARKIPPGVLDVVPFQQEAGNIAYALAEDKGFGDVFRSETGPTAWLAPIYPLLLAAIFKLLGVLTARAFFAAVSLNILFSSAACIPILHAGKKIGSAGAGACAAWLWALFPNAILMPFEWIWDTSLSALLTATLFWATLALTGSERARDWCGYGMLWGLALLTNPSLGVLIPFFFGWLVLRRREGNSLRWKRVGMAAGVALLCCVPWTIRNYQIFHRMIPLRSNLPFELWLGNNDIFDEHTRNGRKSITRTEEVKRYTKLGETAYMTEKWQLAISFIELHPALTLRLAGIKFADFWLGTESPLKNFRKADFLVRVILLASFLTATSALLGIVVAWRKYRQALIPLAAIPVFFPCLYYVTHADLRYRHPIDPIVMLLSAIFLAEAYHLGRAWFQRSASQRITP